MLAAGCRGFQRAHWWNESVPLKDNVLFICCQGNKPFQWKWLFVCVYGPCSIFPFGNAHSLCGEKAALSSLKAILKVWSGCITSLIEGLKESQVRWPEFHQDVFFSLVLMFSFGASTTEQVYLKLNGTRWQRREILQGRRKLFQLIGANIKMDMQSRKWNRIVMFSTGRTWMVWSSLIFELMLVVGVCCSPKRGNIFCLAGLTSLCHLRHQCYQWNFSII